MSRAKKVFSWIIPLCVGFLSPIIYGVTMIFLAGYGFWLAIIASIIIFIVGILLLMVDFRDGVRKDTWKSNLGLVLAINPVLLFISYLTFESSSYTAF